MNPISWVYDTIIYEPIFNGLLYIQKILPNHDLGIAIIAITVAIKGLLYLPSLTSIRASRQLQSLQPKLNALKQQYGSDREKLAQEQMKLYRESKVNPLSSCLPILIQIPFFIALYHVFLNGLRLNENGLLHPDVMGRVYGSLRAYYETTPLNTMFLNFVDLSKSGNIILALLAGAAQFVQSKMLAAPKEPKIPEAKDESMTASMNRTMMYFFPIFTAVLAFRFPSGLALYWFVSTLFTVIQQWIFIRKHPVAPTTPPASAA